MLIELVYLNVLCLAECEGKVEEIKCEKMEGKAL